MNLKSKRIAGVRASNARIFCGSADLFRVCSGYECGIQMRSLKHAEKLNVSACIETFCVHSDCSLAFLRTRGITARLPSLIYEPNPHA